VAADSPFAASRDGVKLAVRLIPKAAAERIIGLIALPEGGAALKVAVTAPPESGKANAALLRLLARQIGLPQRDLSLLAGTRDRRKLVHFAGDPVALMQLLEERLSPWLKPD
jgi:uncharacterized protein (TIGR00251 family)